METREDIEAAEDIARAAANARTDDSFVTSPTTGDEPVSDSGLGALHGDDLLARIEAKVDRLTAMGTNANAALAEILPVVRKMAEFFAAVEDSPMARRMLGGKH